MTKDMESTLGRRTARAGVVLSGLAVALVASPALAAPPETWEDPDHGPLLETLGFLVGLPLLIIALVTLAVYLPSMMRARSTEPSLAFHDRNEWFGGPRKGLEGSTPDPDLDTSQKGGASAQW